MKKLDELKQELKDITKWPWASCAAYVWQGEKMLFDSPEEEATGALFRARGTGSGLTWNQQRVNIKFIAKSPEVISKLIEVVEMQRKALEDFKENGTRHSLHPCGVFKKCGCFDSIGGDNWQSYIRSQNESVRSRADDFIKNTDKLLEGL